MIATVQSTSNLLNNLNYILSQARFHPASVSSVRDLALAAKVNPNTMQRALTELEDLKLIYTERTNGKFVTTDRKRLEKHREKFATSKIQTFLAEMQSLGIDQPTILKILSKGGKKL